MTTTNATEGDWDLVIKPKTNLFDFNLRELIRYRDLVGLLVKRDLASVYKQTVLGWLWFIIQPLLTTVMYMFVFGNIAKIGTDGIPQPLFYYSGTVLWTFFSTNLIKSSETFAAKSGLFGKIYFPRFTVPLSYVATNAFSMGIQFLMLLAFYLYYLAAGYAFLPTPMMLLLPLLVAQLALLSTGLGITISAMTTKYRDLKHLVSFGMHLWMYATPVAYPVSQVPEKWRWAYAVNPVAPIVEAFRFALLGKGSFDATAWIWSIIFSVFIFLAGVAVFNHNERTFIDVV
ncbi:MAG TPA: ABC transporter permease [Spirochaetia bacterium]|nr:ABC transporter permease [Spirochaetia bacterium]